MNSFWRDSDFTDMPRMRRAMWSRAIASAFALWLPMSVGELNALSACTMHGAFAAAASHAVSSSHDRHGIAEHSVAHASHDTAPADDVQHCSCIGNCRPGAALGLASAPEIVRSVVATHELAADAPSAGLRALVAPEFSRPYTTGPPRLSATRSSL